MNKDDKNKESNEAIEIEDLEVEQTASASDVVGAGLKGDRPVSARPPTDTIMCGW